MSCAMYWYSSISTIPEVSNANQDTSCIVCVPVLGISIIQLELLKSDIAKLNNLRVAHPPLLKASGRKNWEFYNFYPSSLIVFY